MKPLPIIALALLAWLGSGFVCAGEPKFYLAGPYGGQNATNPGGMADYVRSQGGWIGHIQKIKPQLDWAGPDAGVIGFNCLGYWSAEGMELDSYDHAVASGVSWIVKDFDKAWRPVCREREVLAYVGNVSWHPRLAALPRLELAALIKRNLEPYKKAEFDGIILDAAAHAITADYRRPKWPSESGYGYKSLDALTLCIIDGMWPNRRAGIEPIPEEGALYADLCTRDCIVSDHQFLPTAKTSHVKGRVLRNLHLASFQPLEGPRLSHRELTARLVARAKEVVQAGQVPVIPAWDLMVENYKPSDFLDADVKGAK